MRAGFLSSAALHVGIIGFMAVSFASPSPYEVTPAESMPIDIISDAEMSKMMAGKKDAPKENPKPVVEKVDAPKQAENLESKVSEKPEVKAANEPSTPPPPPPPPPEAKPAEPKPPAAQAEAKPAPAPPKEAEALAAKPPEPPKEQPKPQEAAQATPPPPAPPKKPKNIPPKVVQEPAPERDFNPNQIAALLNKQDPRRMAALGDTINNTASLGASTGTASSLSQTEIDALRAYIARFWKLPAGAVDAGQVTVVFKIVLSPDRKMIGAPQLVEVQGVANPYAPIVRETAQRALYEISNQDNPFPMLRADRYSTWRELELGFNPAMLN
ncbi:cell envelope biogenesis protein TolA [Ancylobacter sp.]|uniref:cell envelope biogenesis protein TolA n=1 Tax=Ancylobacter sp. TaxID=1872567 RepID=UPI003D129DA4